MIRRAHLTLRLTEFDTPLVKKGTRVRRGEPLLKVQQEDLVEFDLTRLLGIDPAQMTRVLAVAEGATVKEGDVIAKRTGMLSRASVKTPLSGTFTVIEKDKGIVGITRAQDAQEVTAWFDGEVTDLNDEKIVFTVSGMTIPAKDGKGAPSSGKLKVLPQGGVLELPAEVSECVIAVKEALPAVIAKADALGATAVIAEVLEAPPFNLPYLLLDDVAHLTQFHDQTVIVLGDEKQLLILEEERPKTKHTAHAT